MTKEDQTPADKVLKAIEYRLRISRDKVERQVLTAVLLSAGITSLTNSKDNTFVIREK